LYEDDLCQTTTDALVSISRNNEGGDLNQLMVSTVRMSFEIADEVKNFYKDYAIRKGFWVRIRTLQKDLDGKI